MKALVKTKPGVGNLELQDIPIPEISDDDLLLKVDFCGVCGSDLHMELGVHPCSPPVVLGHEYSGTVAKVGRNVSDYEQGDRVAFLRGFVPYPGVDGDGGFAEYMRVPSNTVWKTPDGVSQEEASQFETLLGPMHVIREVLVVQPGKRVVVSGPGPWGLLATNMAKIEGASHVTVLGAPGDEQIRLPKALEMGADEALLFGEEALQKISDEGAPAYWVETSGAPPAIEAAVNTVAKGGRISVTGLNEKPSTVDMARVAYNSITLFGCWGGSVNYIPDGAELIRSGDIKMKALITHVLPLVEWQQAFEMLRTKQAAKILLDPDL